MKKIHWGVWLVILVLLQATVAMGYDCSSGTEVRVNQEANVRQWNLLGTFEFNNGSEAVVTLTRENVGSSTCADAIRLVNPATGDEIIVDNEDAGIGTYTENPEWTNSSGQYGWDPDINDFNKKKHHSRYSDDTGATAEWRIPIPATAIYAVYASWTNAGTRPGNAPYCIEGYGKQVIAVTASADADGAISPPGATEYNAGDEPVYTITPNAGHVIEDVLVDGASVYSDLVFTGSTATYTFPSLSQSHAITATFEDHGDDCGSATAISCGSQTGGEIHANGEYDYFQFTLSERSSVVIETTGSTDTYGYLMDTGDCGTSNYIERNSDSGGGRNFKIDRNLDPGDYYIAVRNSRNDLGSYTLKFDCYSDQGEDCDNAGEIDCNSTTSETISWSGDLDYYRINLPTDYPSLVEIYTTGDTNTYGYLLSTTQGCANRYNRIDRDGNSGDGNNFKIEEQELAPLPAGEYYYVRVSRSNGNDFPLNYDLHVNCRKVVRTITATAGNDGSISPEGDVEVEVGADQTFTFSPDQYYVVKEVIVDGVVLDPTPTDYTFTEVTEGHTIHVNFEVQKDCEPQPCEEPTAQPSECYIMDQSSGGGSWHFIGSFDFVQGSGGSVTVERLEDEWNGQHANSTLADAVKFVNIVGGAAVIVDDGDEGYSESGYWQNSQSDNRYDGDSRYTTQVGATATFRPDLPTGGTYEVYAWWNSYSNRDPEAPYCVNSHVGRAPLIEANAGEHGAISPGGTVTVKPGGDKSFTITPDSSYFIAKNQILVDGVAYYDPASATLDDGALMTFEINAGVGTLTFTGVNADHVVNVYFDDFGNTCDNAADAACGYDEGGTLDFNGDFDYYKLHIDAVDGKTVIIYTEGDTDTFGELIVADCANCEDCESVIASDDDGGASQNFRIERVLIGPADFYIKVKHNNSEGDGAYDLKVECDPPPPPVTITVNINNSDWGSVSIPGYTLSDNQVSVPFGSDITYQFIPELTYCVQKAYIVSDAGEKTDVERDQYNDPYVEEPYTLYVEFVDCIHVEDKDADGYTVGEGDCSDDPALDPDAAEIHPGAVEICDNGVDEDCNGVDLKCALLSNCVDISDMPLDVQMITAPPLLMFLLDDSGSMDWSIMNSEGSSGAFRYSGTNYYYVFDDPHSDNAYTNRDTLDENSRKAWQSQYGGSLIDDDDGSTIYPNALYYNPEVIYTPWPNHKNAVPTLGDAHMDHPLSDPTDIDTLFDVDNDSDGKTGLDDVFCTLSEGGGERIIIKRESGDGSSTSADAVALVRVDKWQNGVAIEDQTDVIIVDNDDAAFTTSGSWDNSSAEDTYGSDSLYSDNNGSTATWLLEVDSAGKYYVFIACSKKEDMTHDGNTVWGYWDTSDTPYTWKNGNIFNRAQHAPVIVYSNGGDSANKLEFKVNQQWIKPKDMPVFVNEDAADWNDRWKTYWQSFWNGGVNSDGSLKTDADAGWGGQDPIIYAPDYWNGLDWLPLGDPIGDAPGKEFIFQGGKRAPHKIVNAHYYTLDNSGDIWLVEIKKYRNDDPNTAFDESTIVDRHIDYYLFTDENNDNYVHGNEISLRDVADVPVEIKTYTEKPDPDNPSTWVTKELDYDHARQNFANWYSYYRRRELTAKAAIGRVVADTKGILVGIETIHQRTTLPVQPIEVEGMDDMTDTFLETLYSIYSNSGTPLRRGLQRIGQYYHADDDKTPSGLGDSPFWAYEDGGECQHAFVIAMTDGYYNGSAPSPSVGNADNDDADDDDEGNYEYESKIIGGVETNVPYGDSYSNTLADVAMHYYERDLVKDDVLGDKVTTRGIDKATHQHMVTYGITFGVSGTLPIPLGPSADYPNCTPECGWPQPQADNPKAVDDLVHAAVNGRGEFMSAKKPEQLVEVLKDLLASLETSSGSGASVTTNTAQLKEGAMVFQGRYSSEGWTGDIIAYQLNAVTGAIETEKWHAAEKLLEQDATAVGSGGRKIITFDGVKGRPFRINPANLDWPNTDPDFDDNVFYLSHDQQQWLYMNNTSKAQKVLNYIRGDHTNEQDQGGSFRNRPRVSETSTELNKLGDIVSSETLNYHHESGDVLYAGSNDGMLHAFDSATGKELWAYLPNLVLPTLHELKNPDYGHLFYINGDHYARNIGDPDNPKIILVGSFRKGAKGVYGLDITNPRPMTEKDAAFAIPKWEYPSETITPQGGKIKVRYGVVESDVDKTWHGTKFDCNVEVTGKVSGAKATIAIMGDQKRELMLWNIQPGPGGDLFFKDEEIAGGGGNAKVTRTLYATIADPDMGYSYSKPLINKSKAGWVVIFGNGYDSARGHAVLYVIKLNGDGSITDMAGDIQIKKIDTDPKGIMANCLEEDRQCNGLSTPVMVDQDNDNLVDFAYAGDLKGNLWKFDLRDSDIANWKVAYRDVADADQPRPLFQAVNANGMEQPITTKPDVVRPCDQSKEGYLVIFGTGRYLGETDFSDLTVQSVYAIWDWQQEWEKHVTAEEASKYYYGNLSSTRDAVQTNCTADADAATQGDGRLCPSDITTSRTFSNTYIPVDVRMVQQTITKETTVVDVLQDDGVTVLPETMTFNLLTDYAVNWYNPAFDPNNTDHADDSGCHVGWYFDLVSKEAGDCSSALAEGARITANPIVRSGLVYLVSTVPTDKPCEAGGSSVFTTADVCTGGRNDDPSFDINGDGVIDDNDLINIGTEDNEIMVSPAGLHFNTLLFAPAFMSAAGRDIVFISAASGEIVSLMVPPDPIGIYFWKERD